MNGDQAEASGSGSTSTAQQVLRAALDADKVPDAQVAQYYRERLQDRRIQITNLDRARPKTGGNDVDARLRAERKLVKRKRRVKSELSELKRLRIATARSASNLKPPATLSETGSADEEAATRESVKAKQRLLSDATKQLRRLQSAPRHRTNQAKKLEPASKKSLSRSQRKRMGLEEVDANISYHLVRPLHDMWRSYIQQLLNIVAMNSKGQLVPNPQFDAESLATMSSGTVSAVQASLIKADLCGAEIEVVRAANPSLVSQRGLVVKETEHTVIIAIEPSTVHGTGRKDSTRTIPKKNAVFAIKVPLAASQSSSDPGYLRFELHGNHMMHTLPSRATRKYKARPTIDF
ncbi:RNases MRP/P 32.9 kDa subunit [Pseudozyma hubeiensis]|nr:RNases MRP/P 32.9 kDa subunit [Pseudozyma hubeiensis]